MKFIDTLKEDCQKIKGKPFKEKVEFFWDYYKISILCVLLAIVLIISAVFSIVNRKETVFSGFLLNCKLAVQEDAFLEGFYEHAGIDSSSQTAAFYTDMMLLTANQELSTGTTQRIMAGINVQDTDFISGDPESFRMCAYNSTRFFMDLRDLLDAETLEKLSGRLYYIDLTIVDAIKGTLGEQVEPNVLTYPENPLDPSGMQNPIPVGIDLTDNAAFHDAFYATDPETGAKTPCYLGIVANTPRIELVLDFIDYLLATEA